MVTGAYVLLAIGGILYLCGWVMLLVLGFKKGLGWGLVILFLSWLVIPLIAFLIKYWEEARLGFFVMVGGLLASGIGGFILVGSVATSAMAEFESFDLPEPTAIEEPTDEPYAQYEPDPVDVDSSAEVAIEPEPEAPEEPAVEAEDERPPLAGTVLGERVDWQPLGNLASLPAYVGELIELRMSDSSRIRVVLDDIQGNILKVTQKVGGGAMSYSVNLDLVNEVWVIK